MSKKKTVANYWYSDVDIMQLLMEKSKSHTHYIVVDSAIYNQDTNSDESSVSLRIAEAIDHLEANEYVKNAVIPINIGNKNNLGIWKGRHWVGIVIKKVDHKMGVIFEISYCDSLGNKIPEMLKQQIIASGFNITAIYELGFKQQINGYDCGPWTVFNLDYIAKKGSLPDSKIDGKFIEAQRALLHPYYDDSSDEEKDAVIIYGNDATWLQSKLTSSEHGLMSNSNKFQLNIDNIKFSFLLHEISIRLLKSKKVNKKYYSVKAKKLQKTLELCKEDFDQNIIETINKLLVTDYGVEENKISSAMKKLLKDNPELFLITQESVKSKNVFLINRKTLPEDLSLDDNYNPQDWLAYIRLFNCSAKRTIRNAEAVEAKFRKEDTQHITFKLYIPTIEHELTLGYEIYNNGTKVALLLNIGSYKVIEQTLSNIISQFNINDKQIAELILDVLNNNLSKNQLYIENEIDQEKLKSLVKYIANLTGLLFFEEAHRNPSSLLLHQMMLELIQFNNLSWSDALKLMPMAPTGATSAAICVNNSYNTSLKYHYDTRSTDKLPGNIKVNKMSTTGRQLVERLINQEFELFKLWLRYKEVDIEKASFNTILDLLLNACKRWYGINLKNTFVTEEYLKQQIDIDLINEKYEQDLYLDYDELKHLALSSLTNLSNIIINMDLDEWQTVADFFGDNDISPFVILSLNDSIDKVLDFFGEDAQFLSENYDLTIFDIFNLYNDGILNVIANDGIRIMNFIQNNDDEVELSEIINLYKNNKKRFYDLLKETENENGRLATEGYVSFMKVVNSISARNSIVKKRLDFMEDIEEQEDSADEASRRFDKDQEEYHYHSDDSQNACYEACYDVEMLGYSDYSDSESQ